MSSIGDYLKSLDRFEGTSVLIVGDMVLDRYVYGSVDRISPEAPIPVLRVLRETEMLGGAGNVYRNIASLGGKGAFTTVIGDDTAGTHAQNLISNVGTEERAVVDPGRPTTIKIRYVSGVQQLLRADLEVATSVGAATEQALIDHARKAIGIADAVVISDYAKGVVTERLAQAVIGFARERGIPVLVDSKPRSITFFRGATLLKPNRRELADMTGLPVGTDEEVVAAALELIRISGVECIVASRSEQGMSIVQASGDAAHLRTEAREVFDVSGAGDTLIAALAMALGSGTSLVDAAEIANHAAGIVVGKIGTAAVRLNDLRAVIASEGDVAMQKYMPLDNAADMAERWRARGVKVGFTNGCFDILHPGHISLIAQARSACDRLILGLNSDESARRIKGPGRPVNNEHSRAAVLSALEDVDAVVLFGDDTPINLIERLRPDVLVKGADYTIDTVVGAEFVMSYGGRVILAKLKPGHSTSGTMAKMSKPADG